MRPRQTVRQWCREHRICARCMARRSLKGKALCGHCTRSKREAQKHKYRREVEAGICTRCHKAKAQPTNKRCTDCQEKHAKSKRKKP